jgi:putative addiction module component (TIGR02574 family)
MTLLELPQVMALPAKEKLQLLDELWEAVAAEFNSVELSQAEKDLLDSRWAAYATDPSSALSLEQFKMLMASRRG